MNFFILAGRSVAGVASEATAAVENGAAKREATLGAPTRAARRNVLGTIMV